MRTLLLTAASVVVIAACHSAPPPPAPTLPPLGDSASAALAWVQSHAKPFSQTDSTASAAERAAIYSLTSGARIIGFSEMVEGTSELPYIMRRALFTLADSGVRGIAIQASMADAMFVDRYVRGGPQTDVRRLLRTLQAEESQRIATRQTIALVNAMREWNKEHPDKQVGFYAFETPTARRAVEYITTLPDSILGAPLRSFLVQRYSCVAMNEGAHWGLEGRASDSTFWSSCAPATVQATDSIVALRHRSSRGASELAFAEQMARMIQHHVSVGLRHISRHEGNAEHVMFLLDQLGPNARLVLWGGDIEMARLTLDKNTVQTAVPLTTRLGAGYRAIGFTVGDGIIRARVPNPQARTMEIPGIGDARLLPPSSGTYEDVFIRATPDAYWLDVRTPPSDMAGAWLKGPRPMRLISETYTPSLPSSIETSVGFPAALDGVVFVKHATPAR